MRVIAGSAKGTKLSAPHGLQTRPTSGRVKEAFFSIIGERVLDAFFLDLFSGSGALGIEALSRGSLYTVFVEKEPTCVQVIRNNLNRCRLMERAMIVKEDVSRALALLSARSLKFSLVYIDPPYKFRPLSGLLTDLDKMNVLLPGCLLTLERAGRERVDWTDLQAYTPLQCKKYGDTLLHFLEYSGI